MLKVWNPPVGILWFQLFYHKPTYNADVALGPLLTSIQCFSLPSLVKLFCNFPGLQRNSIFIYAMKHFGVAHPLPHTPLSFASAYVVQLEKWRHLMEVSTHEFSNQQHEIHYIRTIPISVSLGFLFRGVKQWNFSLKVLIKTSSFLRMSTV